MVVCHTITIIYPFIIFRLFEFPLELKIKVTEFRMQIEVQCKNKYFLILVCTDGSHSLFLV